MTQRFIFDENVMIFAQSGTNASGENDRNCLDLVESIIDICHTIVFDMELWQRTHSQLNRPENQHLESGTVLLRLIADATQQEGKVEIGLSAASFPEETDIPQGSIDDVYIVRLVVETGATLVTADEALRDDLASSSIQARYALNVLSPEDALASL